MRLSLNDQKTRYLISASIVIFSYIIIYFLFLLKTHFLPYGFDNNETFSSLLHAQNLFDFGLGNSFGLTDEATGLLKSAHPYVYTHQGNFPRFYTLLLYKLGFHSAEKQIFLTVFTVGLAGMLLCHHFFAKYISCLFATIVCLLLMTDYVMFAQWQVNIWRVWQFFLFFSSFICCYGLASENRKLAIFASLMNYSCLFYTEISFASFVVVSNCIYIFFLKDTLKRKISNCIIIALCSLPGLILLIGQDIAFLGWDVFLKDLTNTFSSRNQLSLSTQDGIAQVLDFCAKHKIVFWANFNELVDIRNPIQIAHNFYRFCLLPYSPFLLLSALIMVIGSICSFCAQKLSEYCRDFISSRVASFFLILTTTLLFFLSLFCLTFISYPGAFVHQGFSFVFNGIVPIESYLLFVVLYVCFFYYSLIGKSGKNSNSHTIEVFTPALFFIVLLLVCFVFYKLEQYHGSLVLSLKNRTLALLGGQSWLPICLGVILIFSAPFPNLSKKNQVLDTSKTLKNLFPFFVATSLGFMIAYLVFPGYIRTGYLVRYCCFTVFVHITLFTWLFYRLCTSILNWGLTYEHHKIVLSAEWIRNNIFSIPNNIRLFVPIGLLFLFTALWFQLQWDYLKEFPPTDFNFVRLFRDAPFHNKSMISNTYAVPFAYVSQSWGYLDPEFGNSDISTTVPHTYNYKHDYRYLWFADADSNPMYKKPQLYVCWLSYYSIEQFGQPKPKCGDIPLIRDIRNRKSLEFGMEELAHDMSGRDKWSIVRLPE